MAIAAARLLAGELVEPNRLDVSSAEMIPLIRASSMAQDELRIGRDRGSRNDGTERPDVIATLVSRMACRPLWWAARLPSCSVACDDRSWGRAIHLPQGDANRGREAFVDLRCHVCHEVDGFDPPTPIVAETRVRLGGQSLRVKTYNDLVTSIANPSHRLARGYPPETVAVEGVSLMSLIYLNDVMTVQQLVDLVAFLQARYEVVAPPRIKLGDIYPAEDADVLSRAPASMVCLIEGAENADQRIDSVIDLLQLQTD